MGSYDSGRESSQTDSIGGQGRDPWQRTSDADTPGSAAELLESCRTYLLLVANQELDPKLRGKIGPSDVVQETFVRAEEKFTGFRGQTKDELQAWLRRILLNQLTDIRRRYETAKRAVGRERAIHGDSRGHQPAADLAAAGRSPRASMIAREEMAAMHAALGRLPDDYRMVIMMRSLEQREFAEVAKSLGRSENAARKLWSRAVLRLQEELSAIDGDTTG